MAKNIKGITVEIGGDTSKLGKALQEVDKDTRSLQRELKGVNTLLKYDPTNVVLLQQKQDILSESISKTRERLNTLREAQAQVQAQFEKGEITNEQYRDFQRELVLTEQKLGGLEEALEDAQKPADELGEEIEDVGDSAKNAGDKTLKLGDIIKANLISEAIIGGVKLLGRAIKGLVSGVVDLGKQSIAGYADFEQLVGGVDTLFKESSQKVQDYANDAFKTTGLGANEYMENVTAFSASLLQSLGGDTSKAADVAHMAMVDMADNANKMGSSMESIQNAYQGFAKQNYTMLDNLKLGYGGTKSEMERLLKDATALSGIKYDISNLNDVYEAIHVVQTELGITGTTSLEAEETISGSISAMKAAYSNLVTGLADENANLELLVSNLVESAVTVLDNLIPVFQNVVSSMVAIIPTMIDSIMTYLPSFLNTGVELLTSIAYGILEALPTLIQVLVDVGLMLIEKLVEFIPQLLEVGVSLLMSLIDGLVAATPELIPVIIDAILTMVDTLLDNIDSLIDSGISLILALADGLIEALPTLISKIPIIITQLMVAINRNSPKILNAGIQLIISLAGGLIKAIPKLIASVPTIIKNIVKAFTSFNWGSVGSDIIRGIAGGVSKMASFAVDAMKNVAKSMLGGIKKFFGIKSPSTVMEKVVGRMLPQGVAVGIEADTDEAVDAIDSMNKQILRASEPTMVNMLSGNQSMLGAQTPQTDVVGAKLDRLVGVFETTLDRLTNPNYQMVLDTGVIVGEMKNEMDQALGNNQKMKGRGRE